MNKLKVYQWPHETLNQISIPCEPGSYSDEFEKELKTLMVESNGIGLAANQVGITERFFCIGCSYFVHFKDIPSPSKSNLLAISLLFLCFFIFFFYVCY